MIGTRFLEGADHTYQVLRTQDVEPIVDYTKGMNAIGAGNGADMKHAAEIPMVIVESYLARNGITFAEFCESPDHIKAIVNDPSLSAFRIWQGRL